MIQKIGIYNNQKEGLQDIENDIYLYRCKHNPYPYVGICNECFGKMIREAEEVYWLDIMGNDCDGAIKGKRR